MNDIGIDDNHILNMIADKDRLRKEFREFYILNDKESSDDKDLILFQKWHIISKFMKNHVFELPENILAKNYSYRIYEQSNKNLFDLKYYIESIIEFSLTGEKLDFPLKDYTYGAGKKRQLIDLVEGFFSMNPTDELANRFKRIENLIQKNFTLYTSNQYQDWRREANWVKDAIAIESSETKRENYILCKYINRNF